MYVGKTYDRAKSKAELRQWKRRFRRDFLSRKTGPVHEFRDGKAGEEGETVVMEVFYRKPKDRTKSDMIIRPFGLIGLKLADESEKTIPDLRDQVETFSYSYNKGFDPLTGDSLKDVKSFEFYTQKMDDKGNVISIEEKRVPKALDEYKTSQEGENKPVDYAKRRSRVVPDLGVYKMLMDRIFDGEFLTKLETAESDLD